MNNNKKISVYGGSGFIGSSFISAFPSQTIQIPRDQNTPMSDEVLYFISTNHNYHVFDNPHLDIDTNLTKLIDVLEACKNSNRTCTFNFISSWFVYGKKNKFPVTETDECHPEGFYSITKYAAERLLVSYCDTFKMKYRILRLTNIIGENATEVSIKRNALQYLIETLFDNKEVKLYNDGSDMRDFMHIIDACRAIMKCIENASIGETINISNSDPHTIGELVRYAQKRMGGNGKIISVEPPDFHKVVQSKDMHLDNIKLLSYGYAPSINTYDAVDRIVNYIMERKIQNVS
jgi:nucleoside-diphosphate-sugar epimerase